MLIQDIKKIFAHPSLIFKNSDVAFVDQCFESLSYIITIANEKIPDGHDKDEAFNHLNLALYYIAKGTYRPTK